MSESSIHQTIQNPLTREIVVDKCKKANFKEIKNINLWSCELDDISLIREMPNLEVVSMSVNRIESLQYFASCLKIQELYLRKNNISEIREVQHLVGLKKLRVLWLSDNPCSKEQYYR